RYLRWIQVTLYVGSGIFSLISCVTLKVTFDDLRDTCPLYARPAKVELGALGERLLRAAAGRRLERREKKTCYYSMYLNITTASYSLLWGPCSQESKAEPLPGPSSEAFRRSGGAERGRILSCLKANSLHLRRLVFPSLLFNSVLFHQPAHLQLRSDAGSPLLVQLHHQRPGGLEHVKELMRAQPISSWMVSLTLLILSMICGERFFKAVWFGEFEAPSAAAAAAAAPVEVRAESHGGGQPRCPAARGSTGQPRNGMVRENPNAASASAAAAADMQAGHRKALALGGPGTAAAAVAMAEQQQQQQQPDCLPGDTLMANQSALAGYERSLAARQRSAGGQSGRSLGGARSGGLSSSLRSSANTHCWHWRRRRVRSCHRVSLRSKRTQLWEPGCSSTTTCASSPTRPNNSLTMRQHGGGRSRDCNLYSAYRVFRCQSEPPGGRLRQEARMTAGGAPRTIGVKDFPQLLPRPPSSINLMQGSPSAAGPQRPMDSRGISAQRPDTPQHVQRLFRAAPLGAARFRTFGAASILRPSSIPA
uniref:Frizzled domain-containing protein n=1 Tax=Macrostomum lignano TaxID=282301 RepID=A0A1I8F8U0_9PLAT